MMRVFSSRVSDNDASVIVSLVCLRRRDLADEELSCASMKADMIC